MSQPYQVYKQLDRAALREVCDCIAFNEHYDERELTLHLNATERDPIGQFLTELPEMALLRADSNSKAKNSVRFSFTRCSNKTFCDRNYS